MSASRLDQVYRSILMTKFFTKGWGKPENMKRLFEFKKFVSNRESCNKLVSKDYPITITKEETCSDCKIIEGQFLSPFSVHLPGIMPKEAETAYFQMVLPKKWNSNHYKPICLHLAGTGDHGFWRRRQLMAKPLLKKSGIGAILLENPFYGLRKPKDQVRSNLHNVSDIFVMGGCLILESLALFHWCERVGLGPLGITGLSMGGHMASLAATSWPKPIALIPCLSWSTASLVFTKGVMSAAINWTLLEEQYFSNGLYQHEIKKMIQTDENAFLAGQHFAKNYPESMDRITELGQDVRSEKTADFKAPATRNEVPNEAVDRLSQRMPENSVNKTKTQSNGDSTNHSQQHTKSNAQNDSVDTPSQGIPEDSVNETVTQSIKDAANRSQHVKSNQQNANVALVENKSNGNNSSRGWSSLLNLFTRDKSSKSLLSDFSKSKSNLLNFRQDRSISPAQTEIEAQAKEKARETYQFMRGIMDECTHLRNYDKPVDMSLVIAVCAKDDAYVPREGCAGITDIWPAAEVRFLNSGHVGAFLLHHRIFRSTIVEAFERMEKKYPMKVPAVPSTESISTVKGTATQSHSRVDSKQG